jgi:O-antigen ligase
MGLLHTHLAKPSAWPPPRGNDAISATLRYARQRDPIGHRLHLLLALAHVFTLPLSTAGSSVTFALLLVYAILRLPSTWRCYTALLRVPIVWVLVLWTGWMALSLAWSPDPRQGVEELWTMRMALLPPALWPVLDRAPWIIGAALLGVLGQQVAQLLQYTHLLNLRPQEPPGRLGGWIHPIQTGAWCAAAMCWYVSAILTGHGRGRWILAAGLVLAAIGLLATESRGPWLAAVLALPAALLVIALRRPRSWRAAVVLLVAGLLGAAVVWPIAGDAVSARVQQAVEDYQAARDDGIYSTNIGLRVGQWRWTWDIFTGAPVVGVGAGGFRTAQAQQPLFREALRDRSDKADKMTRDHPHSTTLYVLATTGAIGGAIVLAAMVLALLAAWRDRPDHPWSGGTFFLLIVWLIGAQFDCYNLNGHLLGLFMLAVTLTLPCRPPVEVAYTDR